MDFSKIVSDIGSFANFPSKVLEIGDNKFTIALCSTADDRKITKAMELITAATTAEDQENGFDYVKRLTISLCLKQINEYFTPEEIEFDGEIISGQDYLAEKMEEWPTALTDILYAACQDLRKRYAQDLRAVTKFDWFDQPLYEVLDEETDPESKAKRLKEETKEGIQPEAAVQSEKQTESLETPRQIRKRPRQ